MVETFDSKEIEVMPEMVEAGLTPIMIMAGIRELYPALAYPFKEELVRCLVRAFIKMKEVERISDREGFRPAL
jgi:hypothetical protein